MHNQSALLWPWDLDKCILGFLILTDLLGLEMGEVPWSSQLNVRNNSSACL